MTTILFKSVPFSKEDVTLALESGVDGIVTDLEHAEGVRQLALCRVVCAPDMPSVPLNTKEDENRFAERVASGEQLVLARGWEVIPVENLLAQPAVAGKLAVEVGSLSEARLAAGILECGVPAVVVLPEALAELKTIVSELKLSQPCLELQQATVTEVRSVGLGHRVCVDTLSLLQRGQGMLTGNSSAFTFLVHAETEHNEYVAARPFRVNIGAVHAYAIQPGDTTRYVGELSSGDDVLIVDASGATRLATIGRVKTEVRPMLMISAQVETDDGLRTGSVFLQNAETIRLTRPDGEPVSVVALRPGDTILCRLDTAGRHFGMRIQESIHEC